MRNASLTSKVFKVICGLLICLLSGFLTKPALAHDFPVIAKYCTSENRAESLMLFKENLYLVLKRGLK